MSNNYHQTKEEIYAAMYKHLRDKDVAVHYKTDQEKLESELKYADLKKQKELLFGSPEELHKEYNKKAAKHHLWLLLPFAVSGVFAIITNTDCVSLSSFISGTLIDTLIGAAYIMPFVLPIGFIIGICKIDADWTSMKDKAGEDPHTDINTATEIGFIGKMLFSSGFEIHHRSEFKKNLDNQFKE